MTSNWKDIFNCFFYSIIIKILVIGDLHSQELSWECSDKPNLLFVYLTELNTIVRQFFDYVNMTIYHNHVPWCHMIISSNQVFGNNWQLPEDIFCHEGCEMPKQDLKPTTFGLEGSCKAITALYKLGLYHSVDEKLKCVLQIQNNDFC